VRELVHETRIEWEGPETRPALPSGQIIASNQHYHF
jgi:hypothetical protein